MSDHKHLIYDNRLTIEASLKNGDSFMAISRIIGKDPTTISKEVRRNLVTVRTGCMNSAYNSCLNKYSCEKSHVCVPCKSDRKYKLCKRCSLCNSFCSDFEKETCPKLLKPPYCCNACGQKPVCSLEKKLYIAKSAQKKYEDTLKESRSGISYTEEQIQELDQIVSPLLRQSQSPHYICFHHADELMISERTIYRIVEAGLLSARNIDLPRKVRYAARSNPVHVKVDKACRIGRTYEEFCSYMDLHPDTPITQFDSVEGIKGKSVLLTIHFPKCEMMFSFLREHNDSGSVIRIVDKLYEILGKKRFSDMFQLILADNGTEFSNPGAIEKDASDVKRTTVFYCEPSSPQQRGSQERNHEFIRQFIPKGTDIGKYSQQDISLMMDHINSYNRKSLGDKTPYEMFAFMYGQETLDLLGCHLISPEKVTLNKSVFHKGEQS